ncbi:Uncharacterised protein [Legionella lansingensis]|uniref:Dot/Icm T4SS effector n=1 Tax=Legionella lansingensis TaxID=45067 RepID=A0A0W0VT12_9GAMM|nr:hypothetical protein [Legionella lansingensis]KTD23380.1 hypothetical protein Llan_0879 [Legionella lansingensis]SNV49463.1 Uncharacterised protein [Legionella lansingensis]
MTFKIPTLDELIPFADRLLGDYKEERQLMDKNRFLASYRGETNNPNRSSDINFICTVAKNIDKNRYQYQTLARIFRKETPNNQQITEFLRRALAGVYLLHLDKINNEYTFESSVKDRSALAKLLCELFEVEKFSEIPALTIKNCLNDLKLYLRFMTTNAGANLRWHESKSNEILFKEITDAIPDVEPSTQASLSM